MRSGRSALQGYNSDVVLVGCMHQQESAGELMVIALKEESHEIGRTIRIKASLFLMNALECKPSLSKLATFN